MTEQPKKLEKGKVERYLVWIDLEMTGLDPEIDEIIEIATLITDSELNVIAEGPNLVIKQPKERFEKMDEWNQKQHTQSGLWNNVVNSNLTCAQAEEQTLAFLTQFVAAKSCPLAGNSVWQDRRFLVKYMPNLENFLHYRLVDVSTVKELIERWYPQETAYKKNKGAHRALSDIHESVEELRYYRQHFFLSIDQAEQVSKSD